jgi:hypothetical protein
MIALTVPELQRLLPIPLPGKDRGNMNAQAYVAWST